MTTRGLPTMRSFLRSGRCRVLQRCLATSVAANQPSSASPLSGSVTNVDPRINNIVDEISGLTLLQAADLVSALKTRLNIQEIVTPAAAVSPSVPLESVETQVEEKPKEKTIFTVKLESFEASAKPKIIREVKAIIPNLNLIDAKKFVESVPKSLKENLPKEEAEKLKATLEKLGAKVTLE